MQAKLFPSRATVIGGVVFCAAVLNGTLAHAQSTDTASAAAPAPALTANVTLASQYRYRGIMQSNNKPAIQGGFDYAIPAGLLPEGFYVGNWNASISWLSDANSSVSAPIEMDFYGGYK
ncbi:TorF family putative porin, partial [Ralstonia solanacearum]